MAQGDARSYPSTGLAYLALEVKATPARGVRPQFRGHFMPIFIVFHGENIKQCRKIRWISWWTVGGASHLWSGSCTPLVPTINNLLRPSQLNQGKSLNPWPHLWHRRICLVEGRKIKEGGAWGPTGSILRGWLQFRDFGGIPLLIRQVFMSLGLPHQTQKWTNQIDRYCTWECTSPLRCKTSLFGFGHMVNYPWTPLNFDFAWWFPYVLQRLYCYWNLLCLGIGHISVSSIMAMALVPPKNAECIGIL